MVGQLEGRSLSAGHPLVVREISLGGMAFETGTPFEVGAVHAFRLTLGDETTTELSGRIMHCRTMPETSDVFVVGVQFLDDDPPEGTGVLGGLIRRAR